MARNNPFQNADMPNLTDPSDVVNSLEPEVSEGPLGLPVVKPKAAPDVDLPDLPGGGMGSNSRY